VRLTTIAVCAIVAVSCSARGGAPKPPPSVDELKSLVSAAASVPAPWLLGEKDVGLMGMRGCAARSPDEPPGMPLTVAISFATGPQEEIVELPGQGQLTEGERAARERRLAARKARQAAREAEFRCLVGEPSGGRQRICDALLPRQARGARDAYASLIRPEYITRLTRRVDGDAVTGTVHYEAKGVYRGRADYTARRGPKGWRVVEFRLPAHRTGTRLHDGGLWRLIRLDPVRRAWVDWRLDGGEQP